MLLLLLLLLCFSVVILLSMQGGGKQKVEKGGQKVEQLLGKIKGGSYVSKRETSVV